MKRDLKKFPDDDNGNVLWEFRTNGDALTEPREIDFTVILPSEDAAIEFSVICLRSGFKVEMEEAAEEERQEDGLNWNVTVYTHAIPTHSDITALEQSLNERAEPFGGRASGWSAIFVPSA